MDRTEYTLMDAAKKIEKEFLLIGLTGTLKDFLTPEEYDTLRFAFKGILQDSYDHNWEVMNRICQKIDKLAANAPRINHLEAASVMLRNESLNSRPKFVGFEAFTLDELIQKVNEFVSSDKCENFISTEFKISQCAGSILYVGIVTYRAEHQNPDEDDSQKPHDAVKEFASEVRKTIEDTFKDFGGSAYFSFADHGLDLIEAVQDKLDEVLK